MIPRELRYFRLAREEYVLSASTRSGLHFGRPRSARAAGVAWCAGFGRLGGIVGPVATGLMIGTGFGPTWAFGMFAGVATIGVICTMAIPKSPAVERTITTEPTASTDSRARVTEGVS